jgi:hypothetical protein
LEKDKYDSIKDMLNECAKPNAKDLGQALKDIGAPSDCEPSGDLGYWSLMMTLADLRSRDGQVSRAFNAAWLIQQLAECGMHCSLPNLFL